MKTQVIGIALLGTALAGCGKEEPRSRQYFEAHVDEAREVYAGC